MTETTVQPETTVHAVASPDAAQPFLELGLKPAEYARIRDLLGRRPTQTELAMYSIMWSEHCSYKSSKVHLRQFGVKAPASDALLVGMGENAGVVDVGGGLAVTFKIESHNHPSYIEPYQGAATGVGGIVRDILTMGARPIAVLDALRFGDPTRPDTARVMQGVVAGIGGYGNCLGLPNIGGETVFDPCYQTNPLVNAACVGVMPTERIHRSAASGVGNVVVLLGSKTGRDGIGGVSVLASASFAADAEAAAARPSVQVGDPFTEKLLIECCLELFDAGLIVGIQDLGGAGLTCATSETAAAGRSGMRVELERVPLREPSMAPHEIIASESQERMLAIVTPAALPQVLAIAAKWGVLATAIGEVIAGDRLVVTWHGATIADVDPASLADDGPVYQRPIAVPAGRAALIADTADVLPRPRTGPELRDTLLTLLASPNLSDKSWLTEQYDHYVGGNTVLASPADAGMIRLDERTHRGIAIATDGNARYCALDPYAGAQLALAEAYRNVATTGAQPLAVTNCLNFGSPEDPEVMWQFSQAVTGLADACHELGTPVTGGNVSFYNQTGSTPIHPTPVVGVLGIIDDVRRRTSTGFHDHGDEIYLLGATSAEFGGSEWAWVMHQHLGGVPPRVDLPAERALATVLTSAVSLISAAHDLSDGGLAVALAEACLAHGVGAAVELPGDPFVALFAESSARALVAVTPPRVPALRRLCEQHGVPLTRLGVTDAESAALAIKGLFTVDVNTLDTAHTDSLAGATLWP